MNIPVKIPTDSQADELDRMQEGCDLCGAHPVRTELDGDQMCQSCADKWVCAEGMAEAALRAEDEAEELRHALRGAGIYRGAMIEARISDAELLALSKVQRKHAREERRAGGL